MTREEAARVLENIWIRYISTFDYIESEEEDAIDTAIAALRGSQPDPDTGLVPCDYCTDTFDARKQFAEVVNENVGKRGQGCWYCNDDVMQVVDSPNKPPINATYCGLCGRKLEVERMTREEAAEQQKHTQSEAGSPTTQSCPEKRTQSATTDACDRLRWMLSQAERVVRVDNDDRAAVDRACRLMADIDNGFDRVRR